VVGAVDDHHLHDSHDGVEFQPKLFLQRRKDPGAARVRRRRSGAGRRRLRQRGRLRFVQSPFEIEVEQPGAPGSLEDHSADARGEHGRELIESDAPA
jgi:hypothetical protein